MSSGSGARNDVADVCLLSRSDSRIDQSASRPERSAARRISGRRECEYRTSEGKVTRWETGTKDEIIQSQI